MTSRPTSPSRRTGTGWSDVTPWVEGSATVAFVGDVHGNTGWTRDVIAQAASAGARTVVQVGDVGLLWPGDKDRPVRTLEQACEEHDVRFTFIDGNHDSHTRLRALPIATNGFARVDHHIFYAPRGARWTWEGVTFGALGGAHSVDRARRCEGVNLWADLEEITDDDLARLGSDSLDVLVSHEAPAGVDLRGMKIDAATAAACQRQRDLVRNALHTTGATLSVHGHWHQRRTSTLDFGTHHTKVVSLDKEYTPGNWVLLTLPDLILIDPRTDESTATRAQ